MNGRLEQMVDRYLDGDLSVTETIAFEELLASSSEARRLLAQSRAIRSAARSLSSLSTPDPAIESALFQRLFGEEDLVLDDEEKSRRRAGFLPLIGSALGSVGRTALLVPAAIALFILGIDLLESDDPIAATVSATSSPAIALIDPAIAVVPNGIGVMSEGSQQIGPEDLAPSSLDNTSPRSVTMSVGLDVDGSSQSADATQQETKKEDREAAPSIEEGLDIPAPPYASNDKRPEDIITPAFDDPVQNDEIVADVEPELDATFFIDQLAREIDADRRDESPAIAGSPRLAATYRHGVTRMVEASSNVPTQDLNLRIDGRLGNRHRLTLAVGSSPHAVEETTYRFATGIAQDPKGAPPTPASVETERETIAEEEVWAGVGYGYSLYEDERLRIEAGVNLGLGTSANRVGFELPVRVAVTDRIGVEVVGHYTRVMPRNLETSIVEEEEIPLDYLRERRLLDATSLGAQLGISVSLGQ